MNAISTTKTQHTPGPWRQGSRIESDNTLEIRDGSKHSPLAYVSPRPFYNDTQEANARLIAAAPDLLRSLERLEEGVRLWMSKPITQEDMDAARAAIAAAKGGGL